MFNKSSRAVRIFVVVQELCRLLKKRVNDAIFSEMTSVAALIFHPTLKSICEKSHFSLGEIIA